MGVVFTKIADGKLPGRFICRDDKVVTFLTIGPVAPGHTLVIPVEEVGKWMNASPELRARLNEVAQKAGQIVVSAFDTLHADYLIAGFEVPHTHIHIFPAHDMSDYNLRSVDRNPSAEPMDEAAAKLRETLGTDEDERLVR